MTPKRKEGIYQVDRAKDSSAVFHFCLVVCFGFFVCFFGFDILVFLKKKFLFLGLNNALTI